MKRLILQDPAHPVTGALLTGPDATARLLVVFIVCGLLACAIFWGLSLIAQLLYDRPRYMRTMADGGGADDDA